MQATEAATGVVLSKKLLFFINKRETPAQLFSCKYSEIFKNTFAVGYQMSMNYVVNTY